MTCRTYTFMRLRALWRWLTWLGPLGDFRERRATRPLSEDEFGDLLHSGAFVLVDWPDDVPISDAVVAEAWRQYKEVQ